MRKNGLSMRLFRPRTIGITLGLLGIIAGQAGACAWDYDTMSAEAKGLPNTVDAIMGRVAIYPREYYEFRVKRSGDIVAKDPSNLDELDNLIVAYDKFGNSKMAFHFASLKRKALDKHPNKEHEYRYYANLGTIEAHTWARETDHKDKTLLDLSIKHLKRCIEINPDAHFGREIVQVKLIELIRKGGEAFTGKPLTGSDRIIFLEGPNENGDEWDKFVEQTGSEKVARGVIGMMALGGGPDSPDLLAALCSTLTWKQGQISQLALRRIAELWVKKPMFAAITPQSTSYPQDQDLFNRQYAALQKNTEEYRSALSTFVKTKIAQGKHPDVDPHFWDDWKEPAHVDLASLEPTLTQMQKLNILAASVLGGLCFLVVGLPTIIFLVRRRKKLKSLS